MITRISENKASNSYKIAKVQGSNSAYFAKTQSAPDSFKPQVHFSGAEQKLVAKKSRGILSKLFGSVVKEVLSDNSVLKTKFNKKGLKVNETLTQESGQIIKSFFDADGNKVLMVKKYKDFFSAKESYHFNNGEQYLATRLDGTGNYEHFNFFKDNPYKCLYKKEVYGKTPKEIMLNLPKPQEPGTIPDVKMILPIAFADIFNYKVKVKDLDEFFGTIRANVQKLAKENNRQDVQLPCLVESPRHKLFLDEFKARRSGSWACQNLERQGYNVSLPKEENPNAILDVYVFNSREFVNEYNDLFVDNDLAMNKRADKMGKKVAQQFLNSIDKIKGEDKDAADILYFNEVSKIYENKFQSIMNDYHVRVINFKEANAPA